MARARNPGALKINADPVLRARASAAASNGMRRWWASRKLPPMTASQRYKYRLIRERAGRVEALRQVVGSP
jgi:hypothetical protein